MQPHNPHSHPDKSNKVPYSNFNYWISKLFLENSRLTILVLIFLVGVGIFATLNLKTTGFPSPVIRIALVQTIYPGASSEQIIKDVTIPLEGAIKNVDGVTRFNSTSNNSFSNITVFINEQADADSVRNKIDSAVKAVILPEGVETPKLITPDIGGPSVIVAVSGRNLDSIQRAYTKSLESLNQINSISKVDVENELNKQVIIKLDPVKLAKYNLTTQNVSSLIGTIGETIPVISDVTLDGKSAGISTSVKGNDLETLKNLSFSYTPKEATPNSVPLTRAPTTPTTVIGRPIGFTTDTATSAASSTTASIKLSQLAEITVENRYENDKNPSKYAFYNQNTGTNTVLDAVVLNIQTVADTDQGKFIETLRTEMKKIDGIEYATRDEISKNYDESKTYIVESFAVNDDNKEQVDQVISGIIGGKLGDSAFSNIGYALGGIQLIILVMIAFVSWRAALVAAAAIPLSLIFSTIYIYLIGEQLNTLVLFSLVLVLGLVVDPALVILEAIQRKVDSGMKGQKAVLAAVKDVGNGIFLAALTNVIVFVPFGILSGVFGQIFAYIPATVIPAIIGSYIVPLIFLAWLGGLILKPSKNSTSDEQENLWGIAKWMIALNTKILNGSRWVRLIIIIAGIAIPLSIASLLFSNGSIKQVQFAQTGDSKLITLSGSYLNNIAVENKIETTSEILKIIASDKNVQGIVAQSSNFSYYVFLTDPSQRDELAKDIASRLNNRLVNEFGDNSSDPKFFDIKVGVQSTGGPSSDYQVALIIAENNLDVLKTGAVAVGKTIADKLCYTDNKVSIEDNCSSDNQAVIKIDDGFTSKENTIYNIALDRNALIESKLGTPGAGPLSISINTLVKSQFELNNGKAVNNILVDGKETEVFLEPKNEAPANITQALTNIATSTGIPAAQLSSIGSIEDTKPKASIQRIRGKTVGLVQARLKPELQNNQGVASQASAAIIKYYNDNNSQKTTELGLKVASIGNNDNGQAADGQKFFTELVTALLLAIIISYIVLAIFFKSLAQPLGILYTIPLALVGVLPALAAFVGGQFGFLEIIGLIILVGIVENVAIFLIDSANQKIDEDGWDLKRAISYASGVRFRPVILTTVTATASLAPLAILSDFYRSISVVIIFGILASGVLSLVTTPILFIFFKWMSKEYQKSSSLNKFLFFGLPIVGVVGGIYLSGVTGISAFGLLSLLVLAPIVYFIIWGIKDKAVKN
jgi:HAE1 family hydrophobic/amphiphilic exporter-1